jgi:hypothetical protein
MLHCSIQMEVHHGRSQSESERTEGGSQAGCGAALAQAGRERRSGRCRAGA